MPLYNQRVAGGGGRGGGVLIPSSATAGLSTAAPAVRSWVCRARRTRSSPPSTDLRKSEIRKPPFCRDHKLSDSCAWRLGLSMLFYQRKDLRRLLDYAVCSTKNWGMDRDRMARYRYMIQAAGREQLREQGGQRAKFHPTQPPMGPVGSWDGLEVVQGVQLGHRATWFGGGRARPAPAPAPLPPPRTSGWRPAGQAVRLFGCNTASHPFQNLSRPRS
jgi:hypothetical protein